MGISGPLVLRSLNGVGIGMFLSGSGGGEYSHLKAESRLNSQYSSAKQAFRNHQRFTVLIWSRLTKKTIAIDSVSSIIERRYKIKSFHVFVSPTIENV